MVNNCQKNQYLQDQNKQWPNACNKDDYDCGDDNLKLYLDLDLIFILYCTKIQKEMQHAKSKIQLIK